MKDERGVYYYPSPADKRVRMYVRFRYGEVEFRLWNRDFPEIWDGHDWIPYDAVVAAAQAYRERGSGADPLAMYDLDVAKRVLQDEGVACE